MALTASSAKGADLKGPLDFENSPPSAARCASLLMLGLFLNLQDIHFSSLPTSNSWTFDYNAEVVKKADALGFELPFSRAQWLPKGGYDGEASLDSFIALGALGAMAANILLISTIHVLYGALHLLHLAKYGATLDHIAKGRWGINIVTGHRAIEHEMFVFVTSSSDTLSPPHIIDRIASYAAELTAIRHDIHQHPEIGFEEVRTSAIVAEKLASWGIEVHRGYGKTGVVGRLRGKHAGNRSIGLRADMDALPMPEETGLPFASIYPGKFHGCGHDVHTTILLGAARYLAETRDFAGTVTFIFQPAEEGLGGARAMIADGLFKDFSVDEIYGLHNSSYSPPNHLKVSPGTILAGADFFDITLRGNPALLSAVQTAAFKGTAVGPYGHYPSGPLSSENSEGPVFAVADSEKAILGARLSAALEHAHLLIFHLRDAKPQALDALLKAGWSTTGIVTLSQLISFLAFQIRVVAGLKVLNAA